MRKRRNPYLSSTVASVLLHLIFFSLVVISLKNCTSPASVATQPPPMPESIDAEVITQQEINTYYEHKQQQTLAKERALQLEKEKQARAQRLAEERKKAELLKQKKLQEEKKKQEQARLQRQRAEEKERQRQAELRLKEKEEQERIEKERLVAEEKRLEEERLAAEQKRLEEERLAAEQKRIEEERLAAEQKQLEEERLAKEQKRLEEEKKRIAEEKKRLQEEQRRLAERKKQEEAERLKMRKKQIAIWQRQYEQMIRSSVEQHWKKPPTSIKGGECVLKIRQNEEGTVLNVKFIHCNGDKLFIRSVEEAVWKANPLPTPPSPEVFDSEIEFTFKRDY